MVRLCAGARGGREDGSPRAAPGQRLVGPSDGALPGNVGRAKGAQALRGRDVRGLRRSLALGAQPYLYSEMFFIQLG